MAIPPHRCTTVDAGQKPQLADHAVLASSITWGDWSLAGDFTTIDLIAATTNALNGALLARRPDHYRNFTVVGILLMALLGGIGGGITRDVMVAEVPAALKHLAYIALCLAAGVVATTSPSPRASCSARACSSS